MKLYDRYGRCYIAHIQKDLWSYAIYLQDQYIDEARDKPEAENLLRKYATEQGLSFAKPLKKKKTSHA